MADDVILRLATRGAQTTRADIQSVASEARRLGTSVERAATQGSGGLDRLNAQLKNTRAEAQRASQGLTQTGRSMTLFASLPIAAGLYKAEQSAAHLNEVIDFSGRVFKSSSADILEWSDTSLRALGISRTTALDAANSFGTLFNQIGVAPDQVASLSQQMVKLGVDMTSAVDPAGGLDESLGAIRSGLVGENEPLKRFGVLTSETASKQWALAHGLSSGTSELSEQQKVVARLGVILDQGAQFLDNYAQTADSAANSQRRAGDAAKQAGTEFGQTLIPWAKRSAEVAEDLAGAFEGLPSSVQTGVAGLAIAGAVAGPLLSIAGHITQITSAKRLSAAASNISAAAETRDAVATAANAAAKQVAAVSTGQMTLALEGEAVASTAAAAASSRGALGVAALGLRAAGAIGAVAGLVLAAKELAGVDFNFSFGGSKTTHTPITDVGAFQRSSTKELGRSFRAVNTSGNKAAIKESVELFGELATASEGTARRAILGMRQLGASDKELAPYEAALRSAAAGNRQVSADLGDLLSGLGAAPSAFDAAAAAAKDFTDSLDSGVNAVLNAASAHRSYESELAKLNKMQADSGAAEREHADRVREAADAQRDATHATAERAKAEAELVDVRAENVAMLQHEADLAARAAEQQERSARSAATAAQAELARVGGDTASTPAQIAAAQEEVERTAIGAEQATDGVRKAREDAARVGPEHEERVAAATERLADAKSSEEDAHRRAAKAAADAKVPLSELGVTTGELADQMDRVIRAAEADWAARIQAGTATATEATSGLNAQLRDLRGLVSDPALLALLDRILGYGGPGDLGAHPGASRIVARAGGGPVGGRRRYLVGERGPEVMDIAAGASGWVYPNHHPITAAATGRAAGGPVGAALFGGPAYVGASSGSAAPHVVLQERVVRQTRIDNVNFYEQRRLRGAVDDVERENRRKALTV